jgi:NodT family efflux transporter outer membrane factor (OMF) lipoprotein
MRSHSTALTTGLTLMLAACANSGGLHPAGAPLQADTLSVRQSLASATLTPAAWPKQDWWTSLGDSQLSALIAEALQDNPTLAEADARARMAQAEASRADADRDPELDVAGSVREVRVPTTLPPIGKGHNRAAKYAYASFKWNLDLWGGERAAWESALGQQRAAEVESQAARIALSTNVARAYVQLGYAYAEQDVASEELDRASEVRGLTQRRIAAGIDSQVQLKQSDAEVASARGRTVQAERSIDAARDALSVLLGKGPDRGATIARPTLVSPDDLPVPTELPLELLGHRADLVAARWRVEASGKAIAAAKTQFLPNVDITALAGVIMLGGDNLFQAKSRFYDAGPAISLPLFDGGRRRANLSGADAQYDMAVAQYNASLVHAVNEVCDDHDALVKLRLQLAAQQDAVVAARDAWSLARRRYEAGTGSYLQSLIVRQQLLLAQDRMAVLQAEQTDYAVQLIGALGGGFHAEHPAPDAAKVATDANAPSLIHHRS